MDLLVETFLLSLRLFDILLDLLLAELICLLLSDLLLLVELDDTDESDQPDNSDDPCHPTSSTCLGQLSGIVTTSVVLLSHDPAPYPTAIRDHRNSRDDIKYKEERKYVFFLGIGSYSDFSRETNNA